MDGITMTIYAGGVLLFAVPVTLVLCDAVEKHVARVKRERDAARAAAQEAFQLRQAKAREALAALKNLAPAAAGGVTMLEVDQVLNVLRKPSAREPETKPTAPAPRPAPKRKPAPPPPPAAHAWPVTHGSHRSAVEETGSTPLTAWPSPPPPPPAPSSDSGVTASGSWSDSSSGSTSNDGGSTASGSWD